MFFTFGTVFIVAFLSGCFGYVLSSVHHSGKELTVGEFLSQTLKNAIKTLKFGIRKIVQLWKFLKTKVV